MAQCLLLLGINRLGLKQLQERQEPADDMHGCGAIPGKRGKTCPLPSAHEFERFEYFSCLFGHGDGHIHGVAVSVPEQAGKILETLKLMGAGQWTSFSSLTRDCTTTMHIVGRFLALLELFKAKAVDAQQEEPLGQLDLSWTGLDVDPAVVAAANWD